MPLGIPVGVQLNSVVGCVSIPALWCRAPTVGYECGYSSQSSKNEGITAKELNRPRVDGTVSASSAEHGFRDADVFTGSRDCPFP